MNNKKIMFIGLAVFFFAFSAAYGQEQEGFKQHGEEQFGKIVKELNLAPEQQKSLEENRKAQREEMKKTHLEIKEKHAKLREALKNPDVTRAAVEPLVNEIKLLQAQLIDRRINGIFTVKEILTKEQFVKFQQMIEKQQEKRKEHWNWFKAKKKEACLNYLQKNG